MERLLQRSFCNHLGGSEVAGFNQFAYRKERGARDALLLMVCCWLLALNSGEKVAVDCADVAGAFDRVDAERLALKLQALGVARPLLRVLSLGWWVDGGE